MVPETPEPSDFSFSPGQPLAPTQSTFVSVIAWIAIVLGGFTCVISLLQNMIFHVVFPKEEMAMAFQSPEFSETVPPFVHMIFGHFAWFLLLPLLVSTTLLVSGIGLYKRKNWGRIAIIVVMAGGIGWNILSIVFQFSIFNSMAGITHDPNLPAEFLTMMQIMKIATVCMALAFSSLFGFIIFKLCSKTIRREFRPLSLPSSPEP